MGCYVADGVIRVWGSEEEIDKAKIFFGEFFGQDLVDDNFEEDWEDADEWLDKADVGEELESPIDAPQYVFPIDGLYMRGGCEIYSELSEALVADISNARFTMYMCSEYDVSGERKAYFGEYRDGKLTEKYSPWYSALNLKDYDSYEAYHEDYCHRKKDEQLLSREDFEKAVREAPYDAYCVADDKHVLKVPLYEDGDELRKTDFNYISDFLKMLMGMTGENK